MNTPLTSNDFLTDLLTYFQAQCLAGLNYLLPEALFLVWVLGIILICLRTVTEGQIFGSGSWQSYIITVLKISTFIFIVTNWEEISIKIIFKSFELAGQTASNYFQDVHPSSIFMIGFKLTKEVLAGVMKATLTGAVFLVLLKLAMVLAIIAMFAYMAIMFFMVNIEFYIFASLSVILLPFGMISYLKFLFDNVVSALFSYGAKYMAMVFILGVGSFLFSSWNTALGADTQPQELIKAAVGIAVLLLICIKIPDMISGMVHGSPSNDSGTQMAASAVRGVAGAAGGVVGRMALRAGKSTGKKAWNATQGSRQNAWSAAKQGGRAVMNVAQQRSLQALSNIRKMLKK